MKRDFWFMAESKTSSVMGLRFLTYPVFQYGTEKIEEIEIPGRAGCLTKRTGIYSDTIIENELEFATQNIALNELKRLETERWIKSIKKVTYSDMKNYYFRVKKVEVEFKRKYGFWGNVKVVFTCDPGLYTVNGLEELLLKTGEKLKNPHGTSAPIYKILGEGMCTLTVNGKSVTANIGQNLTINTERMLCYRTDGTMQNAAMTGKYENLYLKEGENTISFSSGFQVFVVPNWRVIL